MSSLRPVAACLLIGILSITGCASTSNLHGTTLSRNGVSTGEMIYRISEDTAFTTALDAFATVLPKQAVDDIVDGNRRGYVVDENFGASRWRHRILVVPAIGTDHSGNEVQGYWYNYSGSGHIALLEMREGRQGRMSLLEFIRARLHPTGTAAIVTNLREGQYETDGRAYLGLRRDARDIRPGARPPGGK